MRKEAREEMFPEPDAVLTEPSQDNVVSWDYE